MRHFIPREKWVCLQPMRNYPADLKSKDYNLRKEDGGSQI